MAHQEISYEVWARRMIGKIAFTFGIGVGLVAGFILAWHIK